MTGKALSKGFFVTGTDTGVGKTIVSAALIRSLFRRGIRVGTMKPIETGCTDTGGGLLPSDGMFLKEIAKMDDPLEFVTPVRFVQPLAPMVAAHLSGKSVDLRAIREAYETLSAKYECMIVEGLGGLLVPIAGAGYRMGDAGLRRKGTNSPAESSILNPLSSCFVADLIRDLELPTIVVARATLGTINHTLLTLHYALSEGLKVFGVIINHPSPPENSPAEKTNPKVLKELCPVPILGIVPFIDSLSLTALVETASACLDASLLLSD